MHRTYPLFIIVGVVYYGRPFGDAGPDHKSRSVWRVFPSPRSPASPLHPYPLFPRHRTHFSFSPGELASSTPGGQMGPSFNLHGRVRSSRRPFCRAVFEIVIKNVLKTTARATNRTKREWNRDEIKKIKTARLNPRKHATQNEKQNVWHKPNRFHGDKCIIIHIRRSAASPVAISI